MNSKIGLGKQATQSKGSSNLPHQRFGERSQVFMTLWKTIRVQGSQICVLDWGGGNHIPKGRRCYREGMHLGSRQMALFNRWNSEYVNHLANNQGRYDGRQTVPQVTRSYVMLGFIDNDHFTNHTWKQVVKLMKQRCYLGLPWHANHGIII